jgi:DMSO/TMAO reductase YedYZ molybdopterin-dependent catalytic subunit
MLGTNLAKQRESSFEARRKSVMVKLDPSGYFRQIPLEPHRMKAEITPTRDVFVLCHLGVPQLSRKEWSLTVGGLVKTSKRFDFEGLARYRSIELESVHECAGSPLQPGIPTRRVSNVIWQGIRLADLLDDCGVNPEAGYVWAEGCDHGSFNGTPVPAYVKDLPLSRVNEDVLIATGMNGAPLPPPHGFPARLVVPGFYGTNSVKWLARLTLASSRADSPFTTVWYNDPAEDSSGAVIGTKPVWDLAPNSVIVSPEPGLKTAAGRPIEVWGWAWSDGGVCGVRVTADGGASWTEAACASRRGRGWQRFTTNFTPVSPGKHTLASCARDTNQGTQPACGKRNAWHEVEIEAL